MRKLLLSVTLALLTGPFMSAAVQADVVKLAADHPERYVVVKGDTLWDIANRFLATPWRWPDVWYVNPQIDNPHLIYPGDVIYLVYVDGKPQLRIDRGPRKLSPTVRRTPLEQAIPSIPLQDIKSFLSDNLVLERNTLESAPYVVGGVNDRIVAGAGDKIYARGTLLAENQNFYGVYRPSRTYTDPDSGEFLGFETQSVGGGYLLGSEGDIHTLQLKRTSEEVRVLDRVLPTQEEVVQSVFYPSSPAQKIDGRILAVLDGVTQIGQFDVVTINRGAREGLEPGNLLQVHKAGERVRDPVTQEFINLPSERGGLVMVFKVFEKVSYALVMQAENVLAVMDEVRSPR
ncbi:LysM peptidoglycan-binding domain-containing protein [Motiliproteus sediminis]|uniref:LysM peptidoglycan-binding domain-containing protein n=1 Tax=Motiliproteus sediminis TaxID=1468178 RepID=UPI001AF010D8|nr:LysM domain-containing protein [Motiliproteus sediminis]